MSVVEHLLRIRQLCEHPALYHIADVGDVYCLVAGYRLGMDDDENLALGKALEEFRNYVNGNLGGHPDAPWDKTIEYFSANGFDSVRLCYELISSFVEKLQTSAGSAVGDPAPPER